MSDQLDRLAVAVKEIGDGVGLRVDQVAMLSMLADGIVGDDMMQKLALHIISITPLITGFHEACAEEKAMVPHYRRSVASMRNVLNAHVNMLNEMLDQPDFTDGQKARADH